MTAPIVWWPELHAGFALSVTPMMLMSGSRPPVPVTLAVTPSIDMVGAARAAGTFGLGLTPTIGMEPNRNLTAASFGLQVIPQIGPLVGGEHYARAVALGVTPTIGIGAIQGAVSRSFAAVVTPAVGMNGAGHSLITGVVYTQSSVYPATVAATYANMNDNTASGAGNAAATAQDPGWIRADAGSSRFIGQIIIGYDYLTNLPTGWGTVYTEGQTVQGSNNGTAWTDITTTPTYTGLPNNGLRTITINATWRYIRLLSTATPAAGWLVATEFQLWS